MTAWADLSARAGRNDYPAILARAMFLDGDDEIDDLPVAVEEAWTMPEWPARALDTDLWLAIFDEARGGDDGAYLLEHTIRPHDELPNPLVVYRAAAEGHEHGMSWTTSFDRAHWFATRLGALRPHSIWRLEAPRHLVLARYHDSRGEHEVVIDPTDLDAYGPEKVEPAEWEYLLAAEKGVVA